MGSEAFSGTIYKPGGVTAWEGGVLKVRCIRYFTDGVYSFPGHTLSITADENGQFSTNLGVPDNGWAEYALTLPRDAGALREDVSFRIAAGDGPLTLEAVLAGAASSAEGQETLLTLLSAYLPLAGGVMTGPLVLDGDPTVELEAATKGYVDDNVGGGATDVGDLETDGLTPGNFLVVDNPGGLVEVTPFNVALAIDGDINILNISGEGAGEGNYFRASLADDDIMESRTPAQARSDIGAETAGAAATVQGNLDDHEGEPNPHSVTAAQAGALPEDAAILAKSSGYELAAGDEGKIIECNGTFTVTCPDGLDAGFQVTVVNIGSGTITLSAATTLQGEGTQLETQYTGAVVYHRGSNIWLAMGKLT